MGATPAGQRPDFTKAEIIPGLEPLRRASGGGAVYLHGHDHDVDSVGQCLVWDILEDGKLELECECGLSPLELAQDLGIPLERLTHEDVRMSRQMIAERTLAETPDDPAALAVLALLDRDHQANRG